MSQPAPVPPDGGYGWVVTAASFISNVICGGVGGSFGILLPHLIDTFQETRFVMSWITSIQGGASLLIAPLGSLIGNKIGFRLLAIIATLLSSFGMFVSAFASHYSQLYIVMGAIVGIGNGLSFLSGMVMVNQYFDKRRPVSTGISVTGFGVGLFIFGQIVPLLLAEYTWRGTCIILSGLLLHNLIFSVLFLPLTDENPPLSEEKVEQAIALVDKEQDNKNSTTTPTKNATDTGAVAGSSPARSVNDPNASTVIGSQHSMRKISTVNTRDGKTYFRENPSSFIAGSGFLSSVINISDMVGTTESLSQRKSARINRSSRGSVGGAGLVGSVALTAQPQTSNLYIASLQTLANVPIDETQPKKSCLNLFCNFEIFRDPAVVCFMLTNFLASLGFAPPFVYIIDKAMLMGFQESILPTFLSIMGAFNCIGRFAFGFIANIHGVDKNLMFLASIIGMGVSDVLCQLCQDFWSLMTFCAMFGLCTGVFCMLQCVVLCDLVQDPAKVASALGMFMLVISFSSVSSTPLGGAIYDLTKSYDVVFWIAGVIILASAGLCLPLPVIIRRREARLQEKLQEGDVIIEEDESDEEESPPLSSLHHVGGRSR